MLNSGVKAFLGIMNSVPFKGESHTTGSFGSPEQGQMVD